MTHAKPHVPAGSKPRVLLLENIHPIAQELFEQAGFAVEMQKNALGPEALVEKARDFQVVGIRSKTQVDEGTIRQLPGVTALGCFCVGTSQVSLPSAKTYGMAVFNAPFANTRSVAELVLAEIISLARQLGARNVEMHQGVWTKTSAGCYEVRGKTLGIIGYGNIGTQLSFLAEALGLRVIFYDIVSKLTLGNAKQCAELEDVLKAADFVTLHVPLTPLTENMIGAEEIALMKPGSYLINASRGNVVDIPALAAAVKSGQLGGAAIDVFPEEPEGNTKTFQTPLTPLSNVILTPHIGGATEEAQHNIGREVAAALIRHYTEGTTDGSVNLPIVRTNPLPTGGYRLLNLHKNVPGVLRDINQIVSSAGANIQSQHLATDPQVGYLVMDFDKPLPSDSVAQIEKLGTSIRTRVIA